MRRGLAGLLLAVLVSGPVAASVCEANCVQHRHDLEDRGADASDPGSMAAPTHQHHHSSVEAEPAAPTRAASSAPAPSLSVVLPAHDCCLSQASVEAVTVEQVKSSLGMAAPHSAALWASVGGPGPSAAQAVAHALEPSTDLAVRHLSSILRI
jgi:hypothetical protein